MKKLSVILKVILGILIFILIFGIITFFINKNRVENNKEPLPFTMYPKTLYKDKGSAEYIGLGYKVNKYYYWGRGIVGSKTIYKIGDYNLKYDKDKNQPLDSILEEIFFEYYYALGNDPRTEEENEMMKQKFYECYEEYKRNYGENEKDKKIIEKSVRDYFKLDDSYKLYGSYNLYINK